MANGLAGGADRPIGSELPHLIGVIAKLPENLVGLSTELLRRKSDFGYISVVADGMAHERNRRARRAPYGLERPVVRNLRIGHDVGIIVDRRMPNTARLESLHAFIARQLQDERGN